jgi:hypothetical protein
VFDLVKDTLNASNASMVTSSNNQTELSAFAPVYQLTKLHLLPFSMTGSILSMDPTQKNFLPTCLLLVENFAAQQHMKMQI